MSRSMFVLETILRRSIHQNQMDRMCWTIQTHSDKLDWPRHHTFHELNTLRACLQGERVTLVLGLPRLPSRLKLALVYRQISQVGLPHHLGQLCQFCWRVSSCITFFVTVQDLNSLKFIRLLRVVFSSQQRLNQPAVNAVQWRHSLPENRVVILIGWLSKHLHNYV